MLVGRAADNAVLAIKPIETGVQVLENTDAAKLGAASLPRLAPDHAYAFESPISPHRAARLSGTRIDINYVIRWISDFAESIAHARAPGIYCLDGSADSVLIETAGGVLSPINEKQTNLDLALALEPSCWVLVGADRLGVLHDMHATLTSMQCLARLPDVILLNAPRVPDESTGTNGQELEILGWAEMVGHISYNGGLDDSDREKVLGTLTSPSRANARVAPE
jgi:dethiobiotin synthetase